MKYKDCKKCPKELCKPQSINIFNDNTYCIVPPCDTFFKDATGSKYFLSGAVGATVAMTPGINKFNELTQCITYMICNYNLSFESTLFLTRIKSQITGAT